MHDEPRSVKSEPQHLEIAKSFATEMAEKFDGKELSDMIRLIKPIFCNRISFLIEESEKNQSLTEERIQMLKDELSSI